MEKEYILSITSIYAILLSAKMTSVQPQKRLNVLNSA